jgi:hypothetical protein
LSCICHPSRPRTHNRPSSARVEDSDMASKRLARRDPVQNQNPRDGIAASVEPKRPRLGRPLLDTSAVPTDSEAMRKERIRQAQRNYSNKKEKEVATLKAKAEKAEQALEKMVRSFTRFQEYVSREGRASVLAWH